MGSFFTDVLSFEHEVAVYDVNPNACALCTTATASPILEEISEFKTRELVINAATVKIHTRCFPSGPSGICRKDCIISDIASREKPD